jgi:hypothetical protein
MNEIRTFAFTREESRLMASLLRYILPPELHVIITSGIEPKRKTELVLVKVDNYTTLIRMLDWQGSDEERAYRQVNLEALSVLREVLLSVEHDALPPGLHDTFTAHSTGLASAIQKAIDLPLDKPMFTPVSLVDPVAKA